MIKEEESLWNCTESALKVLWKCSENYRPSFVWFGQIHPQLLLQVHRNCTGTALKLLRNCLLLIKREWIKKCGNLAGVSVMSEQFGRANILIVAPGDGSAGTTGGEGTHQRTQRTQRTQWTQRTHQRLVIVTAR